MELPYVELSWFPKRFKDVRQKPRALFPNLYPEPKNASKKCSFS